MFIMHNQVVDVVLPLQSAIKCMFICLLLLPTVRSDLQVIQSCRNKCGQVIQVPCSCDFKCIVLGNCCEDIDAVCPGMIEQGRRLFRLQSLATIECIGHKRIVTTCHKYDVPVQLGNQTTSANDPLKRQLDAQIIKIMQQEPFENTTADQDRHTLRMERFQNIIKNPFVTDISTGFIYLNKTVFDCFSTATSKPVTWLTQFRIPSITYTPVTAQSVAETLDFIEYISPFPKDSIDHNNNAYCLKAGTMGGLEYIDSCNNGSFQEWTEQCNTGFISLVVVVVARRPDYFKNRYCAYCYVGKDNNLGIIPLTYPRTNRHPMMFTVAIRIQNGDVRLSHADKDLNHHISWTEAVCDTSLNEECRIVGCNKGFVKRKLGLCEELTYAEFAITGDEFPVLLSHYASFKPYMACVLSKVFDVSEHKNIVSIQLDRKTNRPLVVLQFYYFSSITPDMFDANTVAENMRNRKLIIKHLTRAAKLFKLLRRRAFLSSETNLSKIVMKSAAYNKGTPSLSEPVRYLDVPFAMTTTPHHHALQTNINDLDQGTHNNSLEIAYLGLNVTLCFCQKRKVKGQSCPLVCFKNNITRGDVNDFNQTDDVCFRKFEQLVDNYSSSEDTRRVFVSSYILFTVISKLLLT